MYKVMGLCNLHHSPELGELTANRPLASTSFLGRYALIDFTLSNFSNSDIDDVGILVKHGARSILKHLGSANVWKANTKLGFEAIMFNEKMVNNPRYNHDLNNIRANDWVFFDRAPDYFVIAPVHFLMPIDFRRVIEEHIKNKAELTLVYAPVTNGKSNFIGSEVVTLDANGLVSGIHENKGTVDEIDVSLETYVINRATLWELMKRAAATSSFFGLNDIIGYCCRKGEKVHSFKHEGYVRCFDSLSHYLAHSLELLNYGVRRQLFKPDWPIYTVTHDTPPAKYGLTAEVKDSFIANGAIVNGTVERSIISRSVKVEEGAMVRNSIILTDTVIGKGLVLDNVVVDKYAHLTHAQVIQGEPDEPLYIKQGDII